MTKNAANPYINTIESHEVQFNFQATPENFSYHFEKEEQKNYTDGADPVKLRIIRL